MGGTLGVPPIRYSGDPLATSGWGGFLRTRLLSALGRLLSLGLAIGAVVSLLTVGLGNESASAATNGQYSVFPATITAGSPRVFFNYLVGPGSVINDAVTITNQTTQSLAFKLYTTDAVNAKGGDFAYNPPQDPKHSVGAWVQLSDLLVTLPAHTLANIPFTLKIPAGETPGDYSGGIVLSPVNPAVEHRGALTFNVFENVGTRIYVRVKGPLQPGLSITQLSMNTSGFAGYVGGPVSSSVSYTLTNTGNEILNPKAKLSVSPLIGSATIVPPHIFSSLLPHNSVTVTYHFPSKEAFLRFTAHLSVTSAAGTTTASATAWVIPWILVAILILIIGFVWYRRRRRRRLSEAASAGAGAAAQAEPAETAATGA
jgi:hypothetical protein